MSGRRVVGRVDSCVLDSLLLADGREFDSSRYLARNVCGVNNDMTWAMFLMPDVKACCQPGCYLLGLTARCFAFSLYRSRRHTVESFRDKLVILGYM